jgi:hypothetical protein
MKTADLGIAAALVTRSRPVSDEPSRHGRELTLTDDAPIKRLCRDPLSFGRLAAWTLTLRTWNLG